MPRQRHPLATPADTPFRSTFTDPNANTSESGTDSTSTSIRTITQGTPSFMDTSEEEDVGEEPTRTKRLHVHRRQDPRVLAQEMSEEDDQVQLPTRSSSGVSMYLGLSPNPRPGTPSLMLTTATQLSGSYVSFGTIPTSTTSSRSVSPSLMMADKQNRVVGGGNGDGDVYACALCVQLVPRSMSPPPSHFATREPDQAEVHPMFTVPLLTVPVFPMSTVGTYPRRDVGMGYDGRQRSGRHLSVPMLAAVGVPPAGSRHMQARVKGGYALGPAAVPIAKTVSPPPSSTKVGKRRRPQTASAGTGDADMRASGAYERGADSHVGVGIGGDPATKPKSSSVGRGSKLKTALKRLFRWNT